MLIKDDGYIYLIFINIKQYIILNYIFWKSNSHLKFIYFSVY